MKIELSQLLGRQELNSETWHLPHVRPIAETFQELYDRQNVTFFADSSQWDRDPSFNINQLAAAEELFNLIANGEGGIVKVEGSMFSGKDSVAKITWTKIEKSGLKEWGVCVMEHQTGWPRHQSNFLETHWERVNQRKQAAQVRIDDFPESFQDLLRILEKTENKIYLFGEAQFLLDQDSQSESNWQALKFWLKEKQKTLVLFGLNLTYRGEPWPLTKATAQIADQVMVLISRCEGDKGNCPGPGLMTSRLIQGPRGWRPASSEDPLVLVAGKETYSPRCPECFQLFTSQQAKEFDGNG
jgi:thymidine kinase